MSAPRVTVAVPSLNQGEYLEATLESIFSQQIEVEVFVADGGSTDNTARILNKWRNRLAGCRSYPDRGQISAVNESIAQGIAPYVCWLNSDDVLRPGGMQSLLAVLERDPQTPAAYGKVLNLAKGCSRPIRVEPFDERRLAIHCIISQPGTLIRRSAWEQLGGLDENYQMAADYDLWWRLYREVGPMVFVDQFVAINRDHAFTKTNTHRRQHYREAIEVVRNHYGRVPLKWWLAQPYAVWFRSVLGRYQRSRVRRRPTPLKSQ